MIWQLPVFSKLYLYPIFDHLCFCKRYCDYMNDKSQHCAVCSRINPSVFGDDDQTFKDVIIDERDFTEEFGTK